MKTVPVLSENRVDIFIYSFILAAEVRDLVERCASQIQIYGKEPEGSIEPKESCVFNNAGILSLIFRKIKFYCHLRTSFPLVIISSLEHFRIYVNIFKRATQHTMCIKIYKMFRVEGYFYLLGYLKRIFTRRLYS